MADIIQFPGKRQRSLAAYQLRRFAPDGTIRSTASLHAGSDAEAWEQARQLSEGFRAELWSQGRRLDCDLTGERPVAVSILRPIGLALDAAEHDHRRSAPKTTGRSDAMATEKKRANREAKKPKTSAPKTNAAAPSTKGAPIGAPKPHGQS